LACRPIRRGLACLCAAAFSSAMLVCPHATAQVRLTLEEAAQRKPDYSPVHAGETLILRGVVNAPCFHFPGYTLLSIQDSVAGAVIQGKENDPRLESLAPGKEIEVVGTILFVAGAVAIQPVRIVELSQKEVPAPSDVTLRDLEHPKYLGALVRTEGRITDSGYNVAGAFLEIASPGGPYRFFVPRAARLMGFRVGDKVQSTGVAYQYCVYPPYDRYFELLVNDPANIVRTERSWVWISLFALGALLLAVLLVGFVLWSRERRLRAQRERLRKTYQLGEEILGGQSAEMILKRLNESLPEILGVSRVRLYVYNRAGKTLDAIVGEHGEPSSISLSSPPGGTAAGAVACFHYRTLLVIPDIVRSPFPIAAGNGEKIPKSLLFAPMLAQGEVIGVLELDQNDHVHDFTPDEQALAQHLGNQIAVGIRLLDQRSVQEQLFRTEKLAAVGRLISGVVNELQTPLGSISGLANRALERARGGASERDIAAIAAEAQKAAGMVARLVSFAAAEQVEARPISVSALLHNLIEFREGDWKASGIRVRNLAAREPLFVLGSQGQLEQVFLNLLVHAEQSLADAPQKVITVRTSVLAKRLVVEIAFTAPPVSRNPEETASVLGVTRSVIAGHGGEVRLLEKNNADPCFEVELPTTKERTVSVAQTGRTTAADFARRMTALVIEPDESAQRQIMAMLAARGFRVVPVNNSDTALELAHRIRFDVAFCSVHAPGLNWVELSERMHHRVAGFILLSDGYDPELAADFEGDSRFVLPKPVQESELERLLQMLEPPMPAAKNGAA
jgi:GAF domain-containing protein/CheY-like chemotaxis protein